MRFYCEYGVDLPLQASKSTCIITLNYAKNKLFALFSVSVDDRCITGESDRQRFSCRKPHNTRLFRQMSKSYNTRHDRHVVSYIPFFRQALSNLYNTRAFRLYRISRCFFAVFFARKSAVLNTAPYRSLFKSKILRYARNILSACL